MKSNLVIKLNIETIDLILRISYYFPKNDEKINIYDKFDLKHLYASSEVENIKNDLLKLKLINSDFILDSKRFNDLKIPEKILKIKYEILVKSINEANRKIVEDSEEFKYFSERQNIQERTFTSNLSYFLNLIDFSKIDVFKSLPKNIYEMFKNVKKRISSTNEISFPFQKSEEIERYSHKDFFYFYADICVWFKLWKNLHKRYIIEVKFNKNSNNSSNKADKIQDLIKFIIYMKKINFIDEAYFLIIDRPHWENDNLLKYEKYAQNYDEYTNGSYKKKFLNLESISIYKLIEKIENHNNNDFDFNNKILRIYRGKEDQLELNLSLSLERIEKIKDDFSYITNLTNDVNKVMNLMNTLNNDELNKFMELFNSDNPLLYKYAQKYSKNIEKKYSNIFDNLFDEENYDIWECKKTFNEFANNFKKWYKNINNLNTNFFNYGLKKFYITIFLINFLIINHGKINDDINFIKNVLEINRYNLCISKNNSYKEYNLKIIENDWYMFKEFLRDQNNFFNNDNINNLKVLIKYWWDLYLKFKDSNNDIKKLYNDIVSIIYKKNKIVQKFKLITLDQFINFGNKDIDFFINKIGEEINYYLNIYFDNYNHNHILNSDNYINDLLKNNEYFNFSEYHKTKNTDEFKNVMRVINDFVNELYNISNEENKKNIIIDFEKIIKKYDEINKNFLVFVSKIFKKNDS